MSNVVVISGRISDYGPKLRPLPSGKWELNFTLCCEEPGREGQTFTLYVPVLVYGPQCEPLAESLEAGDTVLVTGKLAWTKKITKAGDKSGLAVTTFGVEVLARSTQAETSESAEMETSDESALPVGQPGASGVKKPRKRPYPAEALRGGFQN